jgi:hypothetical protein
MSDENFIVLENQVFCNNVNYFIETKSSSKKINVIRKKNLSVFNYSDKNLCKKLNLFSLQMSNNKKKSNKSSIHQLYVNNIVNINNNNNNNKNNNKKNNDNIDKDAHSKDSTRSYYSYSEISSLDLNSSSSKYEEC